MRKLVLLLSATLLVPVLAQADAPKRKPGLWEVKMSMPGGMGPMVSQQCVGEKSDNLMQQRARDMGRQSCSQTTTRREGNKWIGETECQHDGFRSRTRTEFSGDLNSRYRGEIHTTFTPPQRGMQETRSTLEARWLGACKPGQKPGDVTMTGMPGMPGNMNMDDMMKNMPRQ